MEKEANLVTDGSQANENQSPDIVVLQRCVAPADHSQHRAVERIVAHDTRVTALPGVLPAEVGRSAVFPPRDRVSVGAISDTAVSSKAENSNPGGRNVIFMLICIDNQI